MIKALAVSSVNNFQQQIEIRKLCEICCACFALPNSYMPACSYDTEYHAICGPLKILELNKNTNTRKRLVHPDISCKPRFSTLGNRSTSSVKMKTGSWMFGFLKRDHPEIMLRDSCVDASCLNHGGLCRYPLILWPTLLHNQRSIYMTETNMEA